jgi:FkbM family methyltransferase
MKTITPFTVKHHTKYWDFKFPEYEPETTQWYLDNIRDDWVCLDGGANVGYFTMLFSRLAKSVLAVEPTDLMDMNRMNCRGNGCFNVEFFNVALGNKTGRISDGIFKIYGLPAEVRLYDFTTLDDFCAANNVRRLDLLKLDLDSYEYEALEGAGMMLEHLSPVVVVELNDFLKNRGREPKDVIALLNSHGYRQTGQTNENSIFKKP